MPWPEVSSSLALRTVGAYSGLCLSSMGLINMNYNFFCQSSSEVQGSGNGNMYLKTTGLLLTRVLYTQAPKT